MRVLEFKVRMCFQGFEDIDGPASVSDACQAVTVCAAMHVYGNMKHGLASEILVNGFRALEKP